MPRLVVLVESLSVLFRVFSDESVVTTTILPKSEIRSRTTTRTTTQSVTPVVMVFRADEQISQFETITLVDAGLTNQNIPIEPLLVPQRMVDAIIAVDASADTEYSFPNGSALRTTFERAAILEQNQDVRIRMPDVPSVNGFINGGLNTRPVFFGCNETDTPIIVYVPNYPWSYASNVSTVSHSQSRSGIAADE
jgi:hypothetical protein